MDVDELLRRLRDTAARFAAEDTVYGEAQLGADLFNDFQALDEWLSKGGFLPADWARKGPSDAPLRRTRQEA